jgi:protein-S-isoprenylcysteine O-methyltransferase Ste14
VNDTLKSRLFVAAQFGLLLLLLIWPGSKAGWGSLDFLFEFIGVLFFIGGAVVLVLAIREIFNHSVPKIEGPWKDRILKSVRVVLPQPMDDAKLVTSGVFRTVRHPIYGGLILIGYGIGVGSGPWPHLMFAIALHAVLHYKANLEEKFLGEKFAEYAAYTLRTNRFFPKVEDE